MQAVVLAGPFVGLILTIAFVPLVAPKTWESHYGKIVAGWTAVFVAADTLENSLAGMLHALAATLLLQALVPGLSRGRALLLAAPPSCRPDRARGRRSARAFLWPRHLRAPPRAARTGGIA